MFCPYCKSWIDDGSKFCSNCGHSVEDAGTNAPQYDNSQKSNTRNSYWQPSYGQPYVERKNSTPEASSYSRWDNSKFENRNDSNSTSILIMGILSMAFTCIFFTSPLGIIFGIIGMAKSSNIILTPKSRVGRILSIVGFALGIVLTILLIIYISALSSLYSSLSRYY